MKRFATSALIASALLLTGAGCTGHAGLNANANVAVNPSPIVNAPEVSHKLTFSPPETLEATEGAAYSYSFCTPDSARSGATCGGLAGATQDPTWGTPPYTFSHQFGSRALPPGLALELNGLLKGTPMLPGIYTFGICANDGKDQACGTTTLTVKHKQTLPPAPPVFKKSLKTVISGTGKGTVTAAPTNIAMTFDFSTTVVLTAVPATGSTFDHWEGDCSGSKSSCTLSMTSNKSATAVFTLIPVVPEATFDVKVGSLVCTLTPEADPTLQALEYVHIAANGTAQGPVGTRVELPILSWSTDKMDCGAWTYHAGAMIAVGGTCVRKVGQPETTTWTVDTGSANSIYKSYWNNNRSYSVDVYQDDDIYPKKTDNKTAVCQ